MVFNYRLIVFFDLGLGNDLIGSVSGYGGGVDGWVVGQTGPRRVGVHVIVKIVLLGELKREVNVIC